jgi:hypothetical protein
METRQLPCRHFAGCLSCLAKHFVIFVTSIVCCLGDIKNTNHGDEVGVCVCVCVCVCVKVFIFVLDNYFCSFKIKKKKLKPSFFF